MNENIDFELEQIKREKESAHDDMMWGKPANDIITGISKNDNIRPARAIWEMVQNARDVAKEDGAEILFVRQNDNFIFQHDGIPFDNHTIEALCLQTSSKTRNDIIQIGQYGTGFLTTHKLGLSFELTGTIKLSQNKDYYYCFQNILFDRSPKDKEQMIKNLKELNEEIESWGNSWEQIVNTPNNQTIFKYLHKHPIEQKNANEALHSSAHLAPYVLALNKRIKSISFRDEVNNTSDSYIRGNDTIIDTFEDIELICVDIQQSSYRNNAKNETDIKIYLLRSLTAVAETGNGTESKATVILPIIEDLDGNLRAFLWAPNVPNLFLYLPLLGTENWGFNFILHSSCFTCDNDNRDNLRFVGNGQNNDDQAESNKQLVELSNSMIVRFINRWLVKLKDVKYLAKANFPIDHQNAKLAEYYRQLESYWVKLFDSLNIVQVDSTLKMPQAIHVLHNELSSAAQNDTDLLDALFYFLTEMYGMDSIPVKGDLLYWSETIRDWYPDQPTDRFVNVESLVGYIKGVNITKENLNYLYTFDRFLVTSKHEQCFSNYELIPNVDCNLHLREDLVCPEAFSEILVNVMRDLIPDEVSRFIHPQFKDLFKFEEFDDTKVKECLANYIGKLRDNQDTKRTNLKKSITTKREYQIEDFQTAVFSHSTVDALMELLHAVVEENSTAFEARILPLLDEYYNYTTTSEVKLDKTVYDCRTFYRPLIANALYEMSLSDEAIDQFGSRLKFIDLIYGFEDMRSTLQYYRIYPNQMGVYCYAEMLQKEDSGMPARLKDIYDIIVRNTTSDDSNSVKHELVDVSYAPYFINTTILKPEHLANEIVKRIYERTSYNISNYPYQKSVIEIIEQLDEPLWRSWFSELDNVKSNIMMSVIQDQDKKRHLFRIMQVQDKNTLNTIAGLVEEQNLSRIIELGRKALINEQNETEDWTYKKALGEYVEKTLLEILKETLSDKELHVKPEDVQGGQDFVIYIDNKPFYYIEVKSRWVTSDSVMMSASQLKRSIEKKDRYALFAVDMTDFSHTNVEQHQYPALKESLERISVVSNIGYLTQHLTKIVENTDDEVHIGGDYKAIVPQTLIKEHKKEFELFITELSDKIEKYLSL